MIHVLGMNPVIACWTCIYFLVSDGLSDEQKHFQQVAVDFAKNEMAPYMIEWDSNVWFITFVVIPIREH